MNALEISNLTKKYSNIVAIDNISFTVPQGSILGILGPNGSGKTTTLACITGLSIPTSGDFKWFDNQPNQLINKQIGAIIETPNFFPNITAYKNLQIVAKIKDIDNQDQILQVLERLGLSHRKNSLYSTFSLGMKSRLALAAALLGNPDVLILDEPTNGLDPEGIAFVRNLIKQEAQSGKTIIIASHILDEVQKICTDVVFLKKGKVLAQGKIDTLLSKDTVYIIESDNNPFLKQLLTNNSLITNIRDNSTNLEITIKNPEDIRQISKIAATNNILITKLQQKQLTLEEEFLKLY